MEIADFNKIGHSDRGVWAISYCSAETAILAGGGPSPGPFPTLDYNTNEPEVSNLQTYVFVFVRICLAGGQADAVTEETILPGNTAAAMLFGRGRPIGFAALRKTKNGDQGRRL